MNTTDYEKAKDLLMQIDFYSSQVDLVKKQWSALTDGGGTAKLLIYAGGKSYETVLGEDTVTVTLNDILKKQRAAIKEAQDRLNEIIEYNIPVE